MRIVPQCDYGLQGLMDDEYTLYYLYLLSVQRYKHEHSVSHCIAIEPRIDHCCKSGSETGWEYFWWNKFAQNWVIHWCRFFLRCVVGWGGYGFNKVSYQTVRRWKKKLLNGIEVVQVTVSGKAKVSLVRKIIDCYTIKNIANSVAVADAINFETNFAKMKYFCQMDTSYRWFKTVANNPAEQMLKMFPNFNQIQFSNIVTGDETRIDYVHYLLSRSSITPLSNLLSYIPRCSAFSVKG